MNTHTILTLILLTRYWGVSSGTNLGALKTHFLCLGTRTFTTAPFWFLMRETVSVLLVNKRIYVGSCQKLFFDKRLLHENFVKFFIIAIPPKNRYFYQVFVH
jgi:hypothetical protein